MFGILFCLEVIPRLLGLGVLFCGGGSLFCYFSSRVGVLLLRLLSLGSGLVDDLQVVLLCLLGVNPRHIGVCIEEELSPLGEVTMNKCMAFFLPKDTS